MTTQEEAQAREDRLWTVPPPPRYREHWMAPFDDAIRARIAAGATSILDVGSGRTPRLAPRARPEGCHYVGLDVSAAELALAGPGAYDEVIVADVCDPAWACGRQFDLALSWQVLEHVRSLEDALGALRASLRPGGDLVAMLSGTFSAFGLLNVALPQRVAVPLLARATGRDPATVFPAYYDHCWASALERLMVPWGDHRLDSLYKGGMYFAVHPAVLRLYFAYENWAHRNGHANLATHYLLRCTR